MFGDKYALTVRTDETVSTTARQLKRGTRAGGTDSEATASWLLKFGTHSQRCGRLAKWLIAGRLIALDKSPGVRPIARGEVQH